MGRRWTPEEDAILREHAAKGPRWVADSGLLPGRAYSAICVRRQAIGVQGKPGRSGTSGCGSARARKLERKREREWTDAQREALVLGARDLCQATGHTFAACVRELARVVREVSGGSGS